MHIILILITLYQLLISPLLPSSCRFYPTCSNFAIYVVKKYGVIFGLYLAIRRICRCHPFYKKDRGYR